MQLIMGSGKNLKIIQEDLSEELIIEKFMLLQVLMVVKV